MATATLRYQYEGKEVKVEMDREVWDRIDAARDQTGLERNEFINEAFRWGKEHNPDLRSNIIKRGKLAKTPGRSSAVADKAKAQLVKQRLIDYTNHVEENHD